MYLSSNPIGGRPKKLSPREIAKIKKNMQKVPIIQQKAQVVQAIEAEDAESRLESELQIDHDTIHSDEKVRQETTPGSVKTTRWSRFLQNLKNILGI